MVEFLGVRPVVTSFTVPVDSIEVVTGIDFFAELPDSLEEALESVVNISGWVCDTRSSKVSPGKATEATRCLGVTQKRVQCKRMTKNESKFCWQHQDQVGSTPRCRSEAAPAPSNGQCLAITKKGTRCKRKATKGRYCWQYAK